MQYDTIDGPHNSDRIAPVTRASDPSSLLAIAGDQHWFQKRSLLFFMLERGVLGIVMSSLAFLFYVPKFFCKRDDGSAVECSERQACVNQLGYFIEKERTSLVTAFGLYCDKSVYSEYGKTFVFLFSGTAIIFVCYLSDYFGRKLLHLIMVITLVIGSSIALTSNLWIIMLGTAVNFLSFESFLTFSNLYCNETVGGTFRSRFNAFVNLAGCIFGLLTNIVFIYSTSYELAFYIPLAGSIFMAAVHFYLVETPFFLFRTKNQRGLERSLKNICTANFDEPERGERKVLIVESARGDALQHSDVEVLKRHVSQKEASEVVNREDIKASMWTRSFVTTVAKFMVIFAHDCIVLGFFYMGLQNINKFSLNANSLALQVTSIISFVAACTTAHKIRRKGFIAFQGILSMVIAMSLYIIHVYRLNDNYAIACIEFFLDYALFCSMLYFDCIINLFAAETYPTNVRALGLSISAYAGRLAFAGSPILISSAVSRAVNPLFLSGVSGCLVTVVVMLTRETLNRKVES